MKAKSTLIIACLAVAALMIFGTTRAEAQCCGLDVLPAFVAAGYTVKGAAVVVRCRDGPIRCFQLWNLRH